MHEGSTGISVIVIGRRTFFFSCGVDLILFKFQSTCLSLTKVGTDIMKEGGWVGGGAVGVGVGQVGNEAQCNQRVL